MKKAIFSALVSFAFAAAGAETLTLTVEDAVEMAVSQNLRLKQSGIALRTLERAKDTAWNIFLPSMAASTGMIAKHGVFHSNIPTSSAITDPGNFGVNAGLKLSLPLNVGDGAGIKSLRAKYEAGLLDYEAARKRLERDVKTYFYNILASQENISLQQANIDLAQKRYEQARNNFENGLKPEIEVLSAEVSLAGLQPAYNRAVAGYNSRVLFLKTLIGADRNDEIILVGELPTDLHDLDPEELINKYAAGRLDTRGLDKQIEALEYSKKGVGLKSNTPSLNLGYNYNLSGSNADNNPIASLSGWRELSTLSVTLSWKFDGLIPGSKTNVQLKKLQDNIDSIRLTREIISIEAGTEIANIVADLLTSRLTIEANTSSTEVARKNFELTEEAYNAGIRELLEVESAQNDYLEAQQKLLEAKYQYIAGLIKLEYALNAPMDEFLN